MTVPTVEQAQTFFASDKLISAIDESRISYWISDIDAKGVISQLDWGKLYFNGFMNLLGHYLYFYETKVVNNAGGLLNSESVGQLSKGWTVSVSGNPFYDSFNLTKYGRIYLQLRSQISVTTGGFVAFGGNFV